MVHHEPEVIHAEHRCLSQNGCWKSIESLSLKTELQQTNTTRIALLSMIWEPGTGLRNWCAGQLRQWCPLPASEALWKIKAPQEDLIQLLLLLWNIIIIKNGYFSQCPFSNFMWSGVCCCSVVSDSLQPHCLKHARLPCPSLSLGVCTNSYPLSRCQPTVSPSVAPVSSCPQSFLVSGSFSMSRLFTSGVAKVLELQNQSFQRIRTDFL